MIGQFRIRYGSAFGRENNFYTGIAGQKGYLAGTDGLFAQGATAGDVTYGTYFYTNNSSATQISALNLQHPAVGAGNLAGYYEGKVVSIMFLDSNTTVLGSRINLIGTDNTFATNSFLDLYYHGSAWYEQNRGNAYSTLVGVALGNSSALNANYVTQMLLTYVSTGGNTGVATIQSVSGGMIGQRLLLINNQSTGSIGISTIGNIAYSTVIPTVAGSGLYTLAASGGIIELIKVSNGQWSIIGR